MANVEPQLVKYDGADDVSLLVAFVQAANIHRRHTTPSQLAMVAAKHSKEATYNDKGPRGTFQVGTPHVEAAHVSTQRRSISPDGLSCVIDIAQIH